MMLSAHFSIAELTYTSTGIYNTPGQDELEKLLYLTTYLLEPIRKRFGTIKINSAFRGKQVNEKIGGAKESQHLLGEAADIKPLESDIVEVFNWCRENLDFGQCIMESKDGAEWIHISLPRIGKQNMMAMTYDGSVYVNV